MEAVKIPLTKPIMAHGKQIAEIELREPTGGDLADCGLPFESAVSSNGGQSGKVDTKSVLQYIAVLGALPPSSVRSMAPTDFMAAMGAVLSFFGDSNLATPSTPSSTSQDSTGT